MTAVVSRVVHAWMVPRMNGQYITVFIFASNIGSKRLLEKNGFIRVAVLKTRKEERVKIVRVMSGWVPHCPQSDVRCSYATIADIRLR